MRETVLLLVNNGPEVKKFIPDIYKTLKEAGYTVIVAADSPFVKCTLSPEVVVDYYFSDYFRENTVASLHPDLREHNMNLWETYFPDFERNILFNKYKLGKEYSEQLLINLANFFYDLFIKENVNFFVYENISNSFSYAAYNIAKILSRQYIGLTYSRLPGRIDIHTGVYYDSNRFKANLQEYFATGRKDQEFEGFADLYLNNFYNIRPAYMLSNGLDASLNPVKKYMKTSKVKYILASIKYMLSRKYNKKYDYLILNPLKNSYLSTLRSLKRYLKLKWLNKRYDIIQPEFDKYFLYPLHFHPESSTSVWARHFVDELNTITNIAYNLPFGYKLYVKDHPSAAGFPDLGFYQKLQQIPNVYLVNHNVNTKFLIKNSVAIITLSSTVGFEALILNRPVVLLGRIFYETHPLCYQLNSFEGLYNVLVEVLSSQETVEPRATLYAYYNMTEPGEDIRLLGQTVKKYVKIALQS